jgi:hypothetical protein
VGCNGLDGKEFVSFASPLKNLIMQKSDRSSAYETQLLQWLNQLMGNTVVPMAQLTEGPFSVRAWR